MMVMYSQKDDKRKFIIERYKYNSSNVKIIKYIGGEDEVTIPPDVICIEGGAFQGSKIRHLIIDNGNKDYQDDNFQGLNDGELRFLEKLTFVNMCRHSSMNLYELRRVAPSLKTITVNYTGKYALYAGAYSYHKTGTWANESSLMSNPLYIEVHNGCQIKFSREVDPLTARINAPDISLGHIEMRARESAIRFFFENKDNGEIFPEDRKKKYEKWLSSINEAYIKYLFNEKNMKLLNEILSYPNLKMSVRSYDKILEYAERANELSLKATVLDLRDKYYDIEKVAEREQNTVLNDLLNPERVHAQKQFWSWGYNQNGTVNILACKMEKAEEIEIPGYLGGKKVVSIGDGAFKKTKARKIIIPDGVITIDRYAFYSSDKIEEVIINGNTLQTIGESAFEGCIRLKEIILPDSLKYIGCKAFRNCRFTEFKQPESLRFIGEEAFWGSGVTSIELNNVTLGKGAFIYSAVEKVILKDVTYIPDECFRNCVKMTSVNMFGTYMIGARAFAMNKKLKEITIDSALTMIGKMAFAIDKSDGLKKVNMTPECSLKKIKKMFSGINDAIEYITMETVVQEQCQ